MNTPMGPSMQMAAFLIEVLGAVPWRLLDAAWDAWIGTQRGDRKLARLEKLGAVTTTGADAGVDRIVRLTEAGRLAAWGGRDPEQCWNRPWDGRWRIVLFDVAEKHRTLRIRLQRQLRRARFGYLQDSVWITPDSIESLEETLRDYGQSQAVLSFLEARPCAGATDVELVSGAWDFATINQRYAQHGEILRSPPAPQAAVRAKRDWLRQECHAWRSALEADPLLPEALLPTGYRGRKAWEVRRERLSRILAAG